MLVQQGNVRSVKKKDVGGDLRRISAQMPVVHVVQRNVKERTAPLLSLWISFEGSECWQIYIGLFITIRSIM